MSIWEQRLTRPPNAHEAQLCMTVGHCHQIVCDQPYRPYCAYNIVTPRHAACQWKTQCTVSLSQTQVSLCNSNDCSYTCERCTAYTRCRGLFPSSSRSLRACCMITYHTALSCAYQHRRRALRFHSGGGAVGEVHLIAAERRQCLSVIHNLSTCRGRGVVLVVEHAKRRSRIRAVAQQRQAVI